MAAQQVSLLPLLAATAIAFRDAASSGGRTSVPACLGLAFGPFTLFLFLATPGLLPYAGDRPSTALLEAVGAGADLLVVAAILPFARGARAPRLERTVFPILVAAGLVGLAFDAFAPEAAQGSYYGAYGVARTLGALVLAWGIARLSLLGVAADRPGLQRGAGAMGALAVLIIVAQILQNYLERYGLLVGSVVAGALLFVANPLQRAFERAAEGHASMRWGHGPEATRRREAAYLDAVRIALQDRRLSRAEEVRLHRLAEELGIGAGRAHEILTSVEAAKGAPPAA